MVKRTTEREAFSGPLGEIIAGLSRAAKTVDPEYQDELAHNGSLFVGSLVEKMAAIRRNPLEKPYEKWLGSSRDGLDNNNGSEGKWNRFVRVYTFVPVCCRELFSSGVVLLDLPPLLPYKYVRAEPVTDERKLQSSIDLQTNFARMLGVLGEDETWGDFIGRPSIRCVNMNDYKIAAEGLREDPVGLVRMNHHDIGMIEFPAVLSKRHPGVAVNIRLYPLRGDQPISAEQAITERRTSILMSVFLSTDLFLKDVSRHLQMPADRDQFLKGLCRLISI